MRFSPMSILLSLGGILSIVTADSSNPICYVVPSSTDSSDAIKQAFSECGYNPSGRGKVVFENETYTVAKVMNTSGLLNVDVELYGTLSWDNSNITYWLNNSLPVGYQNQSTAWIFGGDNIHWKGFGNGTLNGNGQAWYDYNAGRSNLAGRPHQITIANSSNSVYEGIRFINSQMWTMTVIHSENMLLQDIYVSSTSTDSSSTGNTDGVDTIYVNNATFLRWNVTNGDDCFSLKANSANILIDDYTCHGGNGFAVGSIGQYPGAYETIQNVTVRNLQMHKSKWGVYLKTFSGAEVGYPPSGGGGGLGFAANLTFEDVVMDHVVYPFYLSQCVTGDCNTSLFNFHNITLENWSGNGTSNRTSYLDCSKDAPCYNLNMVNVSLIDLASGLPQGDNFCKNVFNATGVKCTTS